MLRILFFLLGIIGHEFYHVYQLKKLGIHDYWIEWFPIPRVNFYYYRPQLTKIVTSNEIEIIPSIITIVCWAIAFYIEVTN